MSDTQKSMPAPKTIQAIGNEIAILWEDGSESYYTMETLRKFSPSAENIGERDLMGQLIGGGQGPKEFPGVTVEGWQMIGGYAVQFRFSDGHNTGIYSYQYLKEIAEKPSP
jgi:DUF971 family protein